MKKFLSKKNLMPISLIAMILAFSNTQQAFSQPADGVYFKTTIEIRDFQNNTDTVVLVVKEGATSGIDPELGEINLYGQEPSKVLEARIIQRTAWDSTVENIDLKVDFRFDDSLKLPTLDMDIPYFIKVYAQHYPVSIHLIGMEGICDSCVHLQRQQYNEYDGKRIEGTYGIEYFIKPPLHLCTFKDASENNLLWLRLEHYVSIGEDVYNQQHLYPNPTKDYIIIENGKLGERFEIVNLDGKLIQSFTIESYPYRLDTAKLIKGTYFLKNSVGTIIHKFIKE